jgi:hypothetical protein
MADADADHHITRLDTERGWQIVIVHMGQKYTEYFADEKYGGKRKALLLARARRDEIFAEIDRPPVPGVVAKTDPRDLGISRSSGAYIARPLAGAKAGRHSIARYGDDAAWFRAYYDRRQMEKAAQRGR